MSKEHRNVRAFVFYVIVLSLFLAGTLTAGIEDTVTKSFDVGPGGRLQIETDLGSIEVHGEQGDVVRIEVRREFKSSDRGDAEKAFANFILDFDQKGDDVTVRGEYKQPGLSRLWDRMRNKLRVKFVVTVPKEYNAFLQTKGGSVSVSMLEGDVESHTSGGSLSFDDIRGDILGNTSGGGIELGQIEGNVDVDTSGGAISAERVIGDLDASTSGGSIRIDEVSGTVKAKTSGGSVTAFLSEQPESDCRLTTSGGSVTIYLADGLSFDLDAHASGGSIKTEVPLQIQGKVDKRSIQGALNGGGPQLSLRTSGGSIYIKKK